MIWRLLSVVVIALTLVVNVFAVTALFDAWQIADTAWKPEFYNLGALYVGPITALAGTVQEPLQALVGDRITLPCWWVHVFAIYAASAAAIWAGTMTAQERNQRIDDAKGGVIATLLQGSMSIVFPLAILGTLSSLVVQGFRNRIVSTFLTQHMNTTIAYAVAVFGLYAAANWANINLLDSAPVADQEIQLINDPATSCTFNDGSVVERMRTLASLSM